MRVAVGLPRTQVGPGDPGTGPSGLCPSRWPTRDGPQSGWHRGPERLLTDAGAFPCRAQETKIVTAPFYEGLVCYTD